MNLKAEYNLANTIYNTMILFSTMIDNDEIDIPTECSDEDSIMAFSQVASDFYIHWLWEVNGESTQKDYLEDLKAYCREKFTAQFRKKEVA